MATKIRNALTTSFPEVQLGSGARAPVVWSVLQRGKDYDEGPYDLRIRADIVDRYEFLRAWLVFRREHPVMAEAILRRWAWRVADTAPPDYDFQVSMEFVKDYPSDPAGSWVLSDSLLIVKLQGGRYRVRWAMGFAERVGGVVEYHLRAIWVE